MFDLHQLLNELEKLRQLSSDLPYHLIKAAFAHPVPAPGRETWISCPVSWNQAECLSGHRSCNLLLYYHYYYYFSGFMRRSFKVIYWIWPHTKMTITNVIYWIKKFIKDHLLGFCKKMIYSKFPPISSISINRP